MRTLLLAGLLTLGGCTGANAPTFAQVQSAAGGVCSAVDIGAGLALADPGLDDAKKADIGKAVMAFDGLCATVKTLDPTSATVGQFLSDFAAKAGPLVQGLPLTATQKAEAGVALALIGAFAPFIPVAPPPVPVQSAPKVVS